MNKKHYYISGSFEDFCWKFLSRITFTPLESRELTPKIISLGVLGMLKAGKTQFYNSLKEVNYDEYRASNVEKYQEFVFETENKLIFIESGYDIGGNEIYIKEHYEDIINEKDVIVFIFDVKQYLEKLEYSQNVRDRLNFILKKMDEKYLKIESKNVKYKKFLLIGSHYDQLSEEQRSLTMVNLHKSVEGKKIAELFHDIYLTNLKDRNALLVIIDKAKSFD